MLLIQLPSVSLDTVVKLGPIISVVLSALLVALYFSQYKILKRQTELTETGQRALPRIRTYRLYSWLDKYQGNVESGEIIEAPGFSDHGALFWAVISNSGTGFAENIRAELVIKSPSYKYSVTAPLAHRTNMDQMAFNDQGGVLSPEEDEVHMVSQLRFSRDNLNTEIKESGLSVGEHVSPSELLWMLESIEESPVRIAIFIHFIDGTGRQKSKQLLTTQSDLKPYADLRTTYERGGSVDEGIDLQPDFNYGDETDSWLNGLL